MKRITAPLILLFILTALAFAAVTVDVSGIASTGSTATTMSVSLAVGTHSNRVMLGGGGNVVNYEPTLDFNGSETLTVNSGASISSGFSGASAGYLVAPTQTTANLRATFDGGAEYGAVCGIVIYNAEQSSPLRSAAETTANGANSVTSNITGLTAGDFIFYFVHIYNSNGDGDVGTVSATAGSSTGETKIGEADEDSSNHNAKSACGYLEATTSTENVGFSWTKTTGVRSSLVIEAVKAAATSAPIVVMRRRRG